MTDVNYETIDNETPIELQEIACEAPPASEEENQENTGLTTRSLSFIGVNVQMPESGQGFYSYSPNRNKQFGLASTIEAIKAIGRIWFNNHRTGPLIGIGNISFKGGGPMPPHKSHQKGLDVDIRLLRKDGARVGVSFQDPAYSRQRTQELVNVVRANGVLRVQLLLFNDPNVTGVQPSPGHDDHLHVRFM